MKYLVLFYPCPVLCILIFFNISGKSFFAPNGTIKKEIRSFAILAAVFLNCKAHILFFITLIA